MTKEFLGLTKSTEIRNLDEIIQYSTILTFFINNKVFNHDILHFVVQLPTR